MKSRGSSSSSSALMQKLKALEFEQQQQQQLGKHHKEKGNSESSLLHDGESLGESRSLSPTSSSRQNMNMLNTPPRMDGVNYNDADENCTVFEVEEWGSKVRFIYIYINCIYFVVQKKCFWHFF